MVEKRRAHTQNPSAPDIQQTLNLLRRAIPLFTSPDTGTLHPDVLTAALASGRTVDELEVMRQTFGPGRNGHKAFMAVAVGTCEARTPSGEEVGCTTPPSSTLDFTGYTGEPDFAVVCQGHVESHRSFMERPPTDERTTLRVLGTNGIEQDELERMLSDSSTNAPASTSVAGCETLLE